MINTRGYARAAVLLTIVTVATAVSQTPKPCPECMHDQPVYGGRGPASALPPQSGCDCATDANCPGCSSDTVGS